MLTFLDYLIIAFGLAIIVAAIGSMVADDRSDRQARNYDHGGDTQN